MRLRLALLAALTVLVAGCGGHTVTGPYPVTVIGTLPQAAPVGKGDAPAGKALFTAQGCGACHTYAPAGSKGNVGPNLDNLAADAKKANQGTLAEYIASSIKSPSAYVVPGFADGIMPNFSSLSDKQIADLVAFLSQSP
jgi:mono/diheme cytochrome c family protein